MEIEQFEEVTLKQLNELNLLNKKAIIFDLDGTLIDSVRIWDEIDQHVIKHFSGVIEDLEKINNNREIFLANNSDGHIYLNYCKWLKEKYSISNDAKEILKMRWDAGCEWYKTCDYKKDAEKVINEFIKRGYKLAIATSGVREQVDSAQYLNKEIIKKADFSKAFSFIITQEDVEHKKPHPDIYLKAISLLKLKPEECLVFEDHLNGVKSAKKAGIEVVNVYCPYSDYDRNELNEIADYKINNWLEFYNYLTTKGE